MKLDWLADVFRDAGLTVVEHSGWKTRTLVPFGSYQPVGLMNHHTAGSKVLTRYPDPPFYRDVALERKCNYTIRPDGVVVVLNAGWAADSGYGAPEVLEAVRNDRRLPPHPHLLRSTLLGNRYFVDAEVQHLGNGDPIHPPQREALIVSNAAVCRRLGWDPWFRLIGHREWAPDRKVDPRWDGTSNPMPGIRRDTVNAMTEEEAMWPPINANSGKDPIRVVQDALGVEAKGTWTQETRFAVQALAVRSGTGDPRGLDGDHVNGRMTVQLLEELARRANAGRTWSRKQIAAIAATAGGVGGVTMDQVFEALRGALGG